MRDTGESDDGLQKAVRPPLPMRLLQRSRRRSDARPPLAAASPSAERPSSPILLAARQELFEKRQCAVRQPIGDAQQIAIRKRRL